MAPDRATALFFELFTGLPRQGPGSTPSTRRALGLVPGVGPRTRVLDIGCGTGAQTLVLAEARTAGRMRSVLEAGVPGHPRHLRAPGSRRGVRLRDRGSLSAPRVGVVGRLLPAAAGQRGRIPQASSQRAGRASAGGPVPERNRHLARLLGLLRLRVPRAACALKPATAGLQGPGRQILALQPFGVLVGAELLQLGDGRADRLCATAQGTIAKLSTPKDNLGRTGRGRALINSTVNRDRRAGRTACACQSRTTRCRHPPRPRERDGGDRCEQTRNERLS